ncbi:MAG: PDZ domain-containing protein [Actinobacteria bacterium]|nr:PDZ domain-containing protein [Actinomycetota bacterium]
MRPTTKTAAVTLLLALTSCSPPSQLKELVGVEPPSSSPETQANLDFPAPEAPPEPANLSLGALVHTNEASWDVLLNKSVPSGGALVLAVLPDTPATQIGLQRGDVIIGIEGDTVTHHEQLVTALKLSPDGRHSLKIDKAGGVTESTDVQLATAADLSLLTAWSKGSRNPPTRCTGFYWPTGFLIMSAPSSSTGNCWPSSRSLQSLNPCWPSG